MVTGFMWLLDAACAGADPDIFFPGSGFRNTADAALEYCAKCPVTAQCLDYAVTNSMKTGIWGGMGPDQRKEYKRANGLTARPLKVMPMEHGTERGARQHYRLGEKPCGPCLEAANVQRNRRKRRGMTRDERERRVS
jgi:WhiB family redox-sensing transcriptional regulator